MVLEGTNLLKVFSYKCLTEKRRHPFRNIINTVFPIVVVAIFVFTRTGFKQGGFNYVNIVNKQPSTAELTEDDVVAFYPTGLFSKLLFAPSNDFTEELIEHTRMKLFVTHDRKYLVIMSYSLPRLTQPSSFQGLKVLPRPPSWTMPSS